MWLPIFLIALCIIINGFFAASEIAVVTNRRTRIKHLVDEGIKNADILYKLREKPDRFLATIQIGITLTADLASAIGGAAAVKNIKPLLQAVPVQFISASSEAIAIGIVVIVITFFFLVFGELIPKSLALSNSEAMGLLVAPLIDKFSRVAYVLISLLTASSNMILKPFNKRAFTERAFVSEEEVKLLLEEGGEQGVFELDEKELIHSVFEFTDTSVKEVMIPALQMVTVGISMSADEVKSIILEEKFSRYPVIGKDLNDIRGILYAKDFYNLISRNSPPQHSPYYQASHIHS
ncbi:MAG: HlyC/CorC family transporter [Nitrospirae bacterium]|nr:HlyC/CorC family transporter [Nitrospirota bacterium]